MLFVAFIITANEREIRTNNDGDTKTSIQIFKFDRYSETEHMHPSK